MNDWSPKLSYKAIAIVLLPLISVVVAAAKFLNTTGFTPLPPTP